MTALKIIATVTIVLLLIFVASGLMMVWERNTGREKLWFRIAQISGALMALIMVGSFLVMIWKS
jgi:hypothetical protein